MKKKTGHPPTVPDEVLLDLIRKGCHAAEICKRSGMKWGSGTSQRLNSLCRDNNLTMASAVGLGCKSLGQLRAEARINEYMTAHGRKHVEISDGVVLVGSDAHYFPGIISTAHRAFVKFAKDVRPKCLIMNGDGIDGASISRHPRIGWDSKPKVVEELKAATERMTEIEEACGTKELYWPLGNHDSRFETFLAAASPEYEGVKGFCLKDHFPLWRPCWSVWINEVVIKHRVRSGIHAPHNNVVNSGRSIVTGHLHSLKVSPFSDYNGTRYGVDSGTLASPYGPQFVDYTEDNPVNWRSGFVVLTFWKGKLLWPELVHVISEDEGLVQFRGQVIEV